MTEGRLEDAVRAVSRFLVADASLGKTLEQIAVLARDAIDPAAAVGITLLDDRLRPDTAVYTDQLAPKLDQSQYDAGDGPCLAAFRTGQVVRTGDNGAESDRWPLFSAEATEHGIHSTLSLPIAVAHDVFGAFNMYAREPKAFGPSEESDALLFVTQASVVLANARAYWDVVDLATSLQNAMESRAIIEQAKGKIMAINGCSADAAFSILVRASQRENRKLRDIARELVEGRGRARTSGP